MRETVAAEYNTESLTRALSVLKIYICLRFYGKKEGVNVFGYPEIHIHGTRLLM